MKYAIIGAGRMGCTFAGALTEAGAEVWCVDTCKAHVAAINRHGLTVRWNGREKNYKGIQATENITDIGRADVIFVLVMGMQTRKVIAQAKAISTEDTYVVTMQNGIGNVDTILEAGYSPDRIVHGVINAGGEIVEPGVLNSLISNTAGGIHYGPVSNKVTPVLEQITADLTKGGLRTSLEQFPEVSIWNKLAMNCQSNATCGLANCTLGLWNNDKDALEIKKAIISETVTVANAKGIPLRMDTFKRVLTLNPDSMNSPMGHHIPSTAQDMKAKRESEIDFLNGAVCREGAKLGIPTPYNEVVYRLVKVYEHAYSQNAAASVS